MYQTIITVVFGLLMLGAAAGLFVHGRRALALALGLAAFIHHAAVQYLIYMSAAPATTENPSAQYSVILRIMDLSIFVQFLVILVVCWRHIAPQPNNSFKGTPNGAP